MPDSSVSSRFASSSVMAMRARRAMRRTVARSTDMRAFWCEFCELRSIGVPLAPGRMSGNARSNLEADTHLRHHYDVTIHLGEEFIGCLIEDRERAVMARNTD